MTSAGPAIFFTLGILSSFSSCIVLVSLSSRSKSARNSGSNYCCWHETPMSSGGLRYVYTHPVLRSNLKFDVLKNSLSGGQLNNILPSVVSSRSLSFIRSPTLVLQKSGTYQSRAMVPCCHTVALGWLHFLCVASQPWLSFECLCCCPLTSLSMGDVFCLLAITVFFVCFFCVVMLHFYFLS